VLSFVLSVSQEFGRSEHPWNGRF